MEFGELLGICFTLGGALYGLGHLVDEKYPFYGGIIAVTFMVIGLVLYYFSLKAHELGLSFSELHLSDFKYAFGLKF